MIGLDCDGMAWEKASAGYFDQGCWKDRANSPAVPTLEGSDAKLKDNYSNREDAIEKCAEVAHTKNKMIFALQSGGKCGAADDFNGYRKYGASSDCTDGTGGTLANDVYSFIPEYYELGCYEENSKARAVPSIEGSDALLKGNYKTRKDAIEKCAEVARATGMVIFALSSGGQCAAADDLKNYKKYGIAENCKDGKGGNNANDVYRIMKPVPKGKADNSKGYKKLSRHSLSTAADDAVRQVLDGEEVTATELRRPRRPRRLQK